MISTLELVLVLKTNQRVHFISKRVCIKVYQDGHGKTFSNMQANEICGILITKFKSVVSVYLVLFFNKL